MKQLIWLIAIVTGAFSAHAQLTIKTVNSIVTTAITPLNTKITTLTNQNTAQDKTIVVLQAQLKAYSIDSAATKKQLADVGKALLAKDTQIANLNKNYGVLFDQNSLLYSRTDSLNKRLYEAAVKTLVVSKSLDSVATLYASLLQYNSDRQKLDSGLQMQLNSVQDIGVKALIEANRKDSIDGVAGQITILKTSGGYLWSVSPDLMARILKIEAKLTTTK